MRLRRRSPREWQLAYGFPVDGDPYFGDSAFVQIYHGDRLWAYVTLEGVDLDAVGDERVARARVLGHFAFAGPWDAEAWEEAALMTDLDEAIAKLESLREWVAADGSARNRAGGRVDEAIAKLVEAREWLLENERGCLPVDREGLTRAGSIAGKMSPEGPFWPGT